jgi:hypothetical protein
MTRIPLTLVCLLTVSPALAAPIVPKFAEETATAGIDQKYMGEWTYMVGGGIAAFDCNGDGRDELFLPGGEAKAKLYLNDSPPGGALTFREGGEGVNLDAVSGAYPLDIDGDGITDLAVLRVGEMVLLRGLGQCRFERANEAWGFDGGDAWHTAFAATWEKGNDWPTLAVGTYIDRTQEMFPWGNCTDNRLYRPKGQGFGTPVALKPSFCALAMLFTDWNRSGTPALRIANDREYYKGGQEQLWRVNPGEPPTPYTEKDGWKPVKIWGMGIAETDLNGDGYPDYFLTSMADNRLQMLADPGRDGGPLPTYAESAYPRGITAHRPFTGDDLRPSTAWATQFADVNNDGMDDLFIVKGNVDRMPDFAQADPNNLLLQGDDGTFTEVADKAGTASTGIGRGGLLVDLNLDGKLDMVVTNRRAPAQIWRNVSDAPGNWVEFRLSQDGANRDAIGARVEVRCDGHSAWKEVTVGGGHAGGSLGWTHFGLGDATTAEVRVTWPGGPAGDWQSVSANGFYIVTPGAPPRPWTAAATAP